MRVRGRGRVLVPIALLATLAGCATPVESAPGDADLGPGLDVTQDPGFQSDVASDSGRLPDQNADPAGTWEELARVPTTDFGTTAMVRISVTGAERVALRIRPATPTSDSDALCYTVAPVRADDAVWIEANDGGPASCERCSQRAYSSGGSGFFVWPNDGQALSVDTLRVQGRVEYCRNGEAVFRADGAGLPDELLFERFRPADTRGSTLRLAFLALDGSGVVPGEPESDAYLDEVLTSLTAPFADVGITVERMRVDSASVVGDIIWRQSNLQPLRNLLRTTDELTGLRSDGLGYVRVVLAGCLERESESFGPSRFPRGATTSIPGGGRSPSAVLVALGQCADPVQRLAAHDAGVTIAHELGHYLGLYHSNTADGAHVAEPGARLMESSTAGLTDGETRFSEAQARVMRLHPSVY